MNTNRLCLLVGFCFLIVMASEASSGYTEGTDTTGTNGFCSDSLFGIAGGAVVFKSGSTSVEYSVSGHGGYFNQAFDDLVKAPDTLTTTTKWFTMGICYVVRSGNNTYSKISVVRKLPDGRYVYRYGKNRTAGSLLLTAQSGNPTTRYKPNNLRWTSGYQMPRTIAHLAWERPLPGNNHLKGYILYFSKHTSTIDTLKAINMSQWDSVAFCDTSTTELTIDFTGGYLNLVALYTEGKSDFLKGWCQMPMLIGTSMPVPRSAAGRPGISVSGTSPTGYYIALSNVTQAELPRSLAIYSISGRETLILQMHRGNRYLWDPHTLRHSAGLYIINAQFPNGSVVSRRFSVIP